MPGMRVEGRGRSSGCIGLGLGDEVDGQIGLELRLAYRVLQRLVSGMTAWSIVI